MATPFRNTYLRSDATEAFHTWEHYSEPEITALGAQLAELLRPGSPAGDNGPRPIAILDIGVGDGQFTEYLARGILEALPGATVRIVALDDSQPMLDLCRARLENFRASMPALVEVQVLHFDANTSLTSFLSAQPASATLRFDVAIITYVLHYLARAKWQRLLLDVPEVLHDDGLLVQGQISGMISELDGFTQERSPEAYSRFWSHYFGERNSLSNWEYVYEPGFAADAAGEARSDLRVSRMDPVWAFLSERHDALGMEFAGREVKTWQSKYNLSQFPDLIRKGTVSSLERGLNRDQTSALGDRMEAWLGEHVPEVAERQVTIKWIMEFIAHQKVGDSGATGADLGRRQLSTRYLQFSANRRQLILEDIPKVLRMDKLLEAPDSPTSLHHRFNSLLDFCIVPAIAQRKFVGLVLWDVLNKNYAFAPRTEPDYEDNIEKYLKCIKDDKSLVYFRELYAPDDRVCAHVITIEADGDEVTLERTFGLESPLDDEHKKSHRLLGVPGQRTFVHYLAGVFKPGKPEFGAGGLVVVTIGQKLDPELQRLLEWVAQTELNGLGSAVLYRHQIDTANLAAKAAIMSRNLSHNIGSHVLANPKLDVAMGIETAARLGSARARLSVFHQNIQNRLDFIARAITRSEERAEPMFFLRGVMDGLLKQGVLLDVLLEDQGFSSDARPIRFNIRMNGSDAQHFREYELRRAPDKEGIERFQPVGDAPEPQDGLVGIVGGMIGCQALYSIIENVLRNAAKYGTFRDARSSALHIYIDLRPARHEDVDGHDQYFVIEIWENLSSDDTGAGAEIRGHLQQTLIDELGETRKIGQGIEEMRIAAAILSAGTLFRSDAETMLAASSFGTPGAYPQYVSQDGVKKLSPQPLRCYVSKREVATGSGRRDQHAIVLQALLPRPRLLGVVGHEAGHNAARDSSGIHRCADIAELAQVGPSFGVLLDSDHDAIPASIDAIRRHHHALPLRLLVITQDLERHAAWTASLAACTPADGRAFEADVHLPARRVHVLCSPALHRVLSGADTADAQTFLGASGWEAVLLKLYHAWIAVFKGTPDEGAWKLVIGFERSPEQVQRAWHSPLQRFSALEQRNSEGLPHSALAIEVHVSGRIGPASTVFVASKDAPAFDTVQMVRGDQARLGNLLVFDNHGKALDGATEKTVDSGVRFVHEFSGSKNIALFQALESPPQEPFAFAWLVFSLVESSLLNVAIIDERVAGAAAANDTVLRNLTRAGVFPIFSLRADGADPFWLDPKTLDKVKHSFGEPSADAVVRSEGLALSAAPRLFLAYADRQGQVSVGTPRLGPADDSPIPPLDVVIVHEGVVDMVYDKAVWPKHAEDLLFGFAPRVVRTSGRGSAPRYLSPLLPFLEFSRLSETTYDGLNKYALGRALLGGMTLRARE